MVFLALDEASFVNGNALYVDNGWYAKGQEPAKRTAVMGGFYTVTRSCRNGTSSGPGASSSRA